MGARGPKPKPTQLLKLTGSELADSRPNEPEPTLGTPTMPSWLSPDAKKEWKRVAPELNKMGVLALIDASALAAYCQSWSDYKHAVLTVREQGLLLENDRTGAVHRNPVTNIMNDSRAAVLRFSEQFGLTPSARARIHVIDKGSSDPLAEFIESKNG